MSNEAPRCQHIKTNGTRCGSPALKENQFCYYHQQCLPVTFNYRGMYHDFTPSEFHLPAFEDLHSIQFTLRQVTELILRHKIKDKEASLLLYALQIASSNLKRIMREEPKPEEIVSDAKIEHVVETPEKAAAFSELQHEEIDRIYSCAESPQEQQVDPEEYTDSSIGPSCRFIARTSQCTGLLFACICQRLIGHMMLRSVANEMKMSKHRSAKGARWAAIRCSMQRRSRVPHSCRPWWWMIRLSIAS
jgi:hypothetical protein